MFPVALIAIAIVAAFVFGKDEKSPETENEGGGSILETEPETPIRGTRGGGANSRIGGDSGDATIPVSEEFEEWAVGSPMVQWLPDPVSFFDTVPNWYVKKKDRAGGFFPPLGPPWRRKGENGPFRDTKSAKDLGKWLKSAKGKELIRLSNEFHQAEKGMFEAIVDTYT